MWTNTSLSDAEIYFYLRQTLEKYFSYQSQSVRASDLRPVEPFLSCDALRCCQVWPYNVIMVFLLLVSLYTAKQFNLSQNISSNCDLIKRVSGPWYNCEKLMTAFCQLGEEGSWIIPLKMEPYFWYVTALKYKCKYDNMN